MNWLKSIWNKHLFGKDIPWANIKHQTDGSITISDFNHAFVKSVTEKLPSELIENKFDDEIVELWVNRYNLQFESPKLTVVHGKVSENENIELNISWNKAFITQLRSLGFNGDSDEDIIHMYLNSMSNQHKESDENDLDDDLKDELLLAAQQALDKK